MNVEETTVGWFQILLLFLFSINYVIVSMSHALPVFHNYTPKFYCESNDGTNRTYGCLSSLVFTNGSREGSENNVASCKNGYNWEAEITDRSVVTDWSLICEKSYLMYLGPTVYYVGISIGAWVAGILADRIGRLPVLAICLYTQGTMAVATYIVQSYPAFLVLRGLQGVFAQGLQNTTYILTVELFPKKFRTIVATTMEFFWALGIILLASLSYMIPDWRILQLAVSVPTAATVLYIWIIPESPRWLLAKRKTTEADISLEKIIKYNGCCSGKNRKALVAEADNNSSVNTTPAKPERKSRLIVRSTVEETIKEMRKEDEACELTNLLTPPPNSAQRKSRRTSLRAITENLEKRLSSVETSSPEIPMKEEDDTTFDETLEASSSTKIDEESRVTSNYETSEDDNKKKNENDEVSIVRTSSTEVNVEEQTVNATKKDDIQDIEKIQETNVNTRRNRYLTKYLVVMACEWFTASVTRNLLNEMSPELNKNRHVSFAIGGGLEMIAYVLAYFALSRYGRRMPMSVCQFVNAGVCITVGVIAVVTHSTIAWAGPTRTAVLLVGKISVVCLLATAYLFTVEIFPTVRRGVCLGLCTVAGMVGSLTSPHILSIKNHTTIAAPLSIAGILCLLSGLIGLILPETKNEALPDTVIQIGRTLTKNKIGVANCDSEKKEEKPSNREILREKLFSEDWVDAGNGIIVNFSESKNEK